MSTTTNYTFVAINNGVDNRFTILMNEQTGYYNITKTATLFKNLQEADDLEKNFDSEEAGANPRQPPQQSTRGKRINDWMHLQVTQAKIAECARIHNITPNECTFVIDKSPDNAHRGTYIHPMLYDHFVSWLSPVYSMRVSAILAQHHRAANLKVLKEKDDRIDSLEKKIDEEREEARKRDEEARKRDEEARKRDTAQQAKIDKLLGFAEDTSEKLDVTHTQLDIANVKLDDIQDELTETKEEVQLAKTYLEEKSFTSTMNPSNESAHHYFVVVSRLADGVTELRFTTGQKSYVDGQIPKLLEQGYEIAIQPFYNANGIDLRQNALAEFKQRRKALLKSINDSIRGDDKVFNDSLKEDIIQHNQSNPGFRRSFADEKQSTPIVKVADIPVTFRKCTVLYHANPYMSYDEVLHIVTDVNGITQESPLPSDSSDQDE
jgi:hypothetical protein